MKVPEQWRWCIEVQGEYVEKYFLVFGKKIAIQFLMDKSFLCLNSPCFW
jgi:hypothetical protein